MSALLKISQKKSQKSTVEKNNSSYSNWGWEFAKTVIIFFSDFEDMPKLTITDSAYGLVRYIYQLIAGEF